jgi:hypothetical protein
MKRPGGQERRPDTVSVCDLLNPFEGTGVLKKGDLRQNCIYRQAASY